MLPAAATALLLLLPLTNYRHQTAPIPVHFLLCHYAPPTNADRRPAVLCSCNCSTHFTVNVAFVIYFPFTLLHCKRSGAFFLSASFRFSNADTQKREMCNPNDEAEKLAIKSQISGRAKKMQQRA
uniref:Putative secreted peptide n=1 Tax=Anopheles braziliensis TaxID=58242 RepID=A0A2M3ZQD2_9DIPT